MAINRHFIGWTKPFILEFSRHLQNELCRDRIFDNLLIWVPSSRAGRHLENELHLDVADTEAFHPPECVTPAQYFRRLAQSEAVASEAQCLYAWKRAIQAADRAVMNTIFPLSTQHRGDEWAFEIAEQFMRLRERVMDENATIAGIADSAGLHDADRWIALKAIESGYLGCIKSDNLTDPAEYVSNCLDRIAQSFPYQQIILAGILNLSNRQQAFIEKLDRAGIPVDIYIPCDPIYSEQFDPSGRPSKDFWIHHPIASDLLKGVTHRVPGPREAVPEIISLSQSYASETDALVLGAPDNEISKFLINRIKFSNCDYYTPEGMPFIQTAWGKLIDELLRWNSEQDLASLTELLNHTFFRRWVEGLGFNPTAVQGALNMLKKEHLFTNFRQLEDYNLGPVGAAGTVRKLAGEINNLLVRQQDKTLTESIWGMLQDIARSNDLTDELANQFSAFEQVFQQLHEEGNTANIPHADQFILLNNQLKRVQYYPERVADQRPVVGWLEMPWEIAPHLVIVGLPDSEIPGNFATDTFMTPSLCRKLGFYGREEDAAFHSFRLNLILHSRLNWGKLDIILTDRDLAGDPVLPTRYLFQSIESESLNRINNLLGDRKYGNRSYPRHFGSQLKIPDPEQLGSMSVTGFAAYLREPFHYLLERQFGWEAPGPVLMEMDPRMFGHLAHRAFQSLNDSESGSALLEAGDIHTFLENEVMQQMTQVFGSVLSVPLQIQRDSLLERMRAASGIIATERNKGWFPHKVEWAFHKDMDLFIQDVKIRGKIDVLEKNAHSGEYRIVDYKTSEKNESPEKAHLQALNARSKPPSIVETDFSIGKSTFRWKDLQLPVYQMAVEKAMGVRPKCAYLCLGKAIKDIRMDEWIPSDEHIAAAQICASAIIEDLNQGLYPLPEKISRYDPWAGWFGYDYSGVVDPEWIASHKKGSTT